MKRSLRHPALIPALSFALLIAASCSQKESAPDADFKNKEGGLTYSWSGEEKEESTADANMERSGNSTPAAGSKGTYSTEVLDIAGTAAASGVTEKLTPSPVDEITKLESVSAVKIPEKIIKTADITCRVDDYKKARTDIERIVKKANGYISNENEQNNSYSINNYMVIRVQNKDFDALVSNLTGIAKEVTNKSIGTRDVTAQFVDIQARLKTKKEIEKRYIDLLQKATKIQDILDIEEKIRVLREEIEAKEGELKYLADQVSYSTVNLNFYETYEFEPSDKPGFWNRLGSSMGGGWKGFLGFIVGFAGLWPLWLILGIVGYIVYKTLRRHMKKG